MKLYRERILKNIQPIKKNKRYFLARHQTKRSYNQNEMFEMFEKYGFEKLYLEDISVNEQIEALNSAEFVVGPTGAAWANLIFFKKNTQALIWMPENVKNASFYANLAELAGVKLIHHYFPSNIKNWKDFMHQNEKIIIDVKKIESTIINMLSTQS